LGNGNPLLEFGIGKLKKVSGALYDSHKPTHLSEVFERDDIVVDNTEYVDELAEHMFGLIRKANEEETISKSSLQPVWVEHSTGEALFNLVPFIESLEEHLAEKGIISTSREI
jgi:hypothetical protein